jgi:hypothetical protein
MNASRGSLTPVEVAGCLMARVERKGAVLHLTPDGFLDADLNAIPREALPTGVSDVLARIMLALGDEIKALLRARAVLH